MLTCYSFISCGQHLGTFVTVFVLTLTQKENIPHLNFFAIIALFRELSEMLCLCLPTSIRYITDVRAALQRMQAFLQRTEYFNIEYDPKITTQFNIKNIPTGTVSKDSDKIPLSRSETYTCTQENILPQKSLTANQKHEPPYLILHDVTCKIPQRILPQSPETNRAKILNDVTLNVATAGLVLVCGSVGSGKSSLLATVLGGELLVTNGFVKYSGTLGYVSDTPWVCPWTIRENILFGLPYEEKLYAEIIRACQLEKDFKTFPQQDLALIGEHGATVSGGQRTRIALARAIYSQADIYLLDDPLSSLDAKVAENVFR
jgi:ABC-type multidrug transport system fused ATPase/permease subunit